MKIHCNQRREITYISDTKDYCLPKYNNMHYAYKGDNTFAVYSYSTLIGFIHFPSKLFVEWAHDMHYSVTTSKQATKMSNYLLKTHNIKTQRVPRDLGIDLYFQVGCHHND